MKPLNPRLLRLAPSARRYLGGAAGIAVLQTAVTLAFAWLLADAITAVVENRMPQVGGGWWGSVGLLSGVVLLRGLLMWATEAWGLRTAARTGSELRGALLETIGRRGPSWLDRRNRAALAVTAGHGLDALDPYFARYVPQLVLTAVATPVIIAVMWLTDWASGLTAAVTLPMIPIFLALIGIATRTVQRRQLTVLQQLAARFADTVQGLTTLRIFGRERRAADNVAATAEQYRAETMRVLRFSFLSGFAMELLSSLAVALIAVSVGFRLLADAMPLGVGLFVLLLAPEAFLPIRQVGVQFHAAEEGVVAVEEVFAVLDDASSTSGERAVAVGDDFTGDGAGLAVHEVRVRELPAVSFVARPGTITLIEGPSGVGKSSVLAALRGATAFAGAATWHGRDVRALTPATWIAWAGQQPGLIRGTIADNVALGDEHPDAAAIRAALAAAGASDLDPEQALGVQGEGLSGGQAQRVAVARAFYRLGTLQAQGVAAPVLALDEPSSALDTETEAQLWATLRSIADAGAVVLLVSHRRSARVIADTVVDLGVNA